MKRIILGVILTLIFASGVGATQYAPDINDEVSYGSQGVLLQSKFSGKVVYVNSNSTGARDTVYGPGTHDAPFNSMYNATVYGSLAVGDIVLVDEDHTESVTITQSYNVDGVKFIGLGSGNERPLITIGPGAILTTADAHIKTVGTGLYFENLRFTAGVDAIKKFFHTVSDNITFVNCEFTGSSSMQPVGFIVASGNYLAMSGCEMIDATAGSTYGILIDGTVTGFRFLNNYVYGDFSTAALSSGAVFTRGLIKDNVIINTSAGDSAIKFTADGTGVIANNSLGGNTIGAILDPGAMYCFENYCATGNAVSGTVKP